MTGRVEVFKDARGEFRWRAIAANGELVAVGAEGYTRRWNAKRAARAAFPDWRVVRGETVRA